MTLPFSMLGVFSRDPSDPTFQHSLDVVTKLGEGVVARPVVRDDVDLVPLAAGELEEVVTGIHC